MLISYLITTRNLTLCLIIRYNTSVCRKINKRRKDFELLCRKSPVAHPYMCHKFIGCLLLGSITCTKIKAPSQDSRSQTGDTRGRCLTEDQPTRFTRHRTKPCRLGFVHPCFNESSLCWRLFCPTEFYWFSCYHGTSSVPVSLHLVSELSRLNFQISYTSGATFCGYEILASVPPNLWISTKLRLNVGPLTEKFTSLNERFLYFPSPRIFRTTTFWVLFCFLHRHTGAEACCTRGVQGLNSFCPVTWWRKQKQFEEGRGFKRVEGKRLLLMSVKDWWLSRPSDLAQSSCVILNFLSRIIPTWWPPEFLYHQWCCFAARCRVSKLCDVPHWGMKETSRGNLTRIGRTDACTVSIKTKAF